MDDTKLKSNSNKSAATMETISISDGDESPTPRTSSTSALTSSEMVKKRKSLGSGKPGQEEERYRLKRRKIKVAGAPKMPLTGYVRYMNDRRESLRKEQPTKTAMEHTKLIGEEWNQLPEERKGPYMLAAEEDKQRYLSELHVFLKARPDVLACELAKNKPRKSLPAVTETAATTSNAAKSLLKDKSPASTVNAGSFKDAKEAAKHLTKDDLALNAVTKARPVANTRRLSVNYTMPPRFVHKETTPPPPQPSAPKVPTAAEPSGEKAKAQKSAVVSNIVEKAPQTAVAAAAVTTNVKPTRKRTPTPPSLPPATSQNSNNNNINNFNAVPTITTTSNTATASQLALTATLPGEIPIFTNDFLEHNKTFDLELRTLRKSKADLEQQNAVLEKHVENMKFGVEKMANENDELQEKNRLLEIYLDKLKRKLANALSGLAIPTQPQGATVDNIDLYMNDLYKMATSNTHGPASLNKAKDIIRKLDLQIQL